jgi:plasmid stabilization system protein ParE
MAKRKHRVVVAKEARDDLRKELDYLRRRRSDQVARHVNRGIQETIKSLDTFPERHTKLHRISDEKRTYRFVPQWSYLIIYRVAQTVVRVVSIFNASQDDDKLDELKGR